MHRLRLQGDFLATGPGEQGSHPRGGGGFLPLRQPGPSWCCTGCQKGLSHEAMNSRPGQGARRGLCCLWGGLGAAEGRRTRVRNGGGGTAQALACPQPPRTTELPEPPSLLARGDPLGQAVFPEPLPLLHPGLRPGPGFQDHRERVSPDDDRTPAAHASCIERNRGSGVLQGEAEQRRCCASLGKT